MKFTINQMCRVHITKTMSFIQNDMFPINNRLLIFLLTVMSLWYTQVYIRVDKGSEGGVLE
jgi:hypothetical protein